MLSKNKLILALLCYSLAACVRTPAPPTTAEIESVGIQALHAQLPAAIRSLQKWAEAGNTVAQRELSFAYAAKPETAHLAIIWLEKAAQGGDAEAQFQLAEAHYKGRLNLKPDYPQAWKWYESAAKNQDARASFMLARMSKYGQGTTQNLANSVNWLKIASDQGNPQAMFLLSNAYAAGEGIEKNPALARKWLEASAEHDFPIAIQALAMEMETGSQFTEKDPVKARHLLKEASDERLMHWNSSQ